MNDSEPSQVLVNAPTAVEHWMTPVVIAALVAIGGVTFFHAIPLVVVALLVLLGGIAFLRWPDVTTLFVIGMVYSNLPVVAVQFHGAPRILAPAVLAMLGWPLLHHLWIRQERILLYPVLPYVLCFLVVQLIGALTAIEPATAFAQFVSFVLEGAVLYFLVTNLIRTQRMLRASFWVLTMCGVLMGGAPLLQRFGGLHDSNLGGLAQANTEIGPDATVEEAAIQTRRATGTIGEQNRYAQFMLVLVPIGLSLAASEPSRRLRIIARVATVFALLGAMLALSRGAAIGCVLAVGVAAFLRLIDRSQMKLIFAATLGMLLLLPHYLTRLASIATVGEAMTQDDSGLGQTDGAVRGRLTEMGAALLIFRDHPLVGVGPGMFGKYVQDYGQIVSLRPLGDGRQAHSLPLDIAAENGLFGLLVLTALFFVVTRGLLVARKQALGGNDNRGAHLVTGILLAVILYLTNGLFLHLSYIRYFWLLVALADAASQIVLHGDQGSDALPERLKPAF